LIWENLGSGSRIIISMSKIKNTKVMRKNRIENLGGLEKCSTPHSKGVIFNHWDLNVRLVIFGVIIKNMGTRVASRRSQEIVLSVLLIGS
jgi:hypothetical protein